MRISESYVHNPFRAESAIHSLLTSVYSKFQTVPETMKVNDCVIGQNSLFNSCD